jgi:hypothetical protein
MTDDMLINLIAERAASLYRSFDIKVQPVFIAAELHAVHREVVPLRLNDLRNADDSNFAHDVAGIHRHLIYGKPCRLGDCFLPRFAVV